MADYLFLDDEVECFEVEPPQSLLLDRETLIIFCFILVYVYLVIRAHFFISTGEMGNAYNRKILAIASIVILCVIIYLLAHIYVASQVYTQDPPFETIKMGRMDYSAEY